MSQMQAGQYLHTAGTQPLTTTDGKLDVRASELESILNTLAKEGKLEQVRALLEQLEGKDFATQATLAQAVQKLEALVTRLDQTLTVSGEVEAQLKGSDIELPVRVIEDDIPVDGLVRRFLFNQLDGNYIPNLMNPTEEMGVFGGADWSGVCPDGSPCLKLNGDNQRGRVISAGPLPPPWTVVIAFNNTKLTTSRLWHRSKVESSEGSGFIETRLRQSALEGVAALDVYYWDVTDSKTKLTTFLLPGLRHEYRNKFVVLAITYVPGRLMVHLNGAFISQAAVNMDTMVGSLVIGNTIGTASIGFQGLVSDYLEYHRELSDKEHYQIAQALSDKLQITPEPDNVRRARMHAKGLPSRPCLVPTPEGSGQVVHPGVVEFASPWNGYNFWMANTPYPMSDKQYELPIVLVSNDGQNWQEPPGIQNPIETWDGSVYYPDTDLFFDSASNQLWMYYLSSAPGTTRYYRRTSSNGVDWSARQEVMSLPYEDRILSPAVLHNGTEYVLYGVRHKDRTVARATSADGITWSALTACTSSGSPQGQIGFWHCDVSYDADDGKYYLWATDSERIYLYESSDGLAFSFVKTLLAPVDYEAPGEDADAPWASKRLYRPAVSRAEIGYYRLWFGTISRGGIECRTGYTDVRRIGGEWVSVPCR